MGTFETPLNGADVCTWKCTSESTAAVTNGTWLENGYSSTEEHPRRPNKVVTNGTLLSNGDSSAHRDTETVANNGASTTTFDGFATSNKFILWSEPQEKILLGPYEYLYGHPGKDIRSQLITAFNAWLGVPDERLQIIAKVVGMLHTASLLVDDVEDSSQLRRGVPVAHNIFGTAQTINSANYVYFCALRELQKLPSPKAVEIYTDELLNLHRGQGMDLYWRDTLTCPSEGDYLKMVRNKTGGLFRLAVKLMQAESSSKA